MQAGGTRDVSRRVPTRPVLLDKDRGALPRWPVRGGPGHPLRRAVQSERGAPSSKTEKFKLGPAEPEPRRGVLCGCPGHTRGTALAVWSCSRASTGPELEGTGSSGLGIERTQRGSALPPASRVARGGATDPAQPWFLHRSHEDRTRARCVLRSCLCFCIFFFRFKFFNTCHFHLKDFCQVL